MSDLLLGTGLAASLCASMRLEDGGTQSSSGLLLQPSLGWGANTQISPGQMWRLLSSLFMEGEGTFTLLWFEGLPLCLCHLCICEARTHVLL